MFRKNTPPEQPPQQVPLQDHSFEQYLALPPSPTPPQTPAQVSQSSHLPQQQTSRSHADVGANYHPSVKKMMQRGTVEPRPEPNDWQGLTSKQAADAIERQHRRLQQTLQPSPFAALDRVSGYTAHSGPISGGGGYSNGLQPNIGVQSYDAFGHPHPVASSVTKQHRIKDKLLSRGVMISVASLGTLSALGVFAAPRAIEAYNGHNAAQIKLEKLRHPALMASSIPCKAGGLKVADAKFNAGVETGMPLPIKKPNAKKFINSIVRGPELRFVSDASINACGLPSEKQSIPIATFDSDRSRYVINRAAFLLLSAKIADPPCNVAVGKDPEAKQLCFVGPGGVTTVNGVAVKNPKSYQADTKTIARINSYIARDPKTHKPTDAKGRKTFETIALVKTRAQIMTAFERSDQCVGVQDAIDKSLGDFVRKKIESQDSLPDKSVDFQGDYVPGIGAGYKQAQKANFMNKTISLGKVTISCSAQ